MFLPTLLPLWLAALNNSGTFNGGRISTFKSFWGVILPLISFFGGEAHVRAGGGVIFIGQSKEATETVTFPCTDGGRS